MVLIFGISAAVAAAYALWTRMTATNPVAAGMFAERVHVQTNVLVRVASVVHAIISLFAGLRPTRLPSMPRSTRVLHGRRIPHIGQTVAEWRENGEDTEDDDD